MKPFLVTILGPTAVGKTKLAAQLAFKFNGEIISADSRQVYKRMNIGTGKDYDDYIVNNHNIKYHLIDIIDPKDEYNLFEFIKDFNNSFKSVTARNKLPFLVGGSGLYLESLLKNYSLEESVFASDQKAILENKTEEELGEMLRGIKSNLHNTTDLIDKERLIRALLIENSKTGNSIKPVEFKPIIIGVFEDRSIIKKRITDRLKSRLDNGMIEEVRGLLNNGISFEKLQFFGLEYKYISQYISGQLNYNDMFQKLNSAIHQFAKRQMTWFRKMERNGIEINWIKAADFDSAVSILERSLAK